MTKALFFDIDGTLVSFVTHQIPQSTVEALELVKKAGHKIIISTGRPYCIINNLSQIEHLIDGYVTTNGAYCFAGKSVIRQLSFNPADANIILEDAHNRHYPLIIVNNTCLRVVNSNDLINNIFVEQLNIHNLDYSTPLEQVFNQPIMQMTAFISREHEEQLLCSLNETSVGRWHPAFTDFTPAGANKGEGILAMAKHFGIDRSDTIAFGDGGNDVPMFKAAGVSVAMGNAAPATKAAASMITTHIDEDGIANAIQNLQLI